MYIQYITVCVCVCFKVSSHITTAARRQHCPGGRKGDVHETGRGRKAAAEGARGAAAAGTTLEGATEGRHSLEF